jgi:hypothetical protein
MDIYMAVKSDYGDFAILGVYTEQELAEKRVEDYNTEHPHGDARVKTVPANKAIFVGTMDD